MNRGFLKLATQGFGLYIATLRAITIKYIFSNWSMWRESCKLFHVFHLHCDAYEETYKIVLNQRVKQGHPEIDNPFSSQQLNSNPPFLTTRGDLYIALWQISPKSLRNEGDPAMWGLEPWDMGRHGEVGKGQRGQASGVDHSWDPLGSFTLRGRRWLSPIPVCPHVSCAASKHPLRAVGVKHLCGQGP